MIIAVASDNLKVTGHFGHCETFELYETENGKITKAYSVVNPGHKPGFLPNFLNEQGVNTIVSGGMGEAAVKIFNSHQMEVIIGATGGAKEAAEKYLNGELKSTGSVCHDHNH